MSAPEEGGSNPRDDSLAQTLDPVAGVSRGALPRPMPAVGAATAPREARDALTRPFPPGVDPALPVLLPYTDAPAPDPANAARFWSGVALNAIRIDCTAAERDGHAPQEQPGLPLSTRALALVHLAMHDAYFSVLGTQPTWLPDLAPPDAANDPDAALAGAAETALQALYRHPAHARAVDQARAAYMVGRPMSEASARWGQAVADQVLADRADDLAFHADSPGPGPRPYRHRPDPLHPGQGRLGPNWGRCRPFVAPRVTLEPPPGRFPGGFMIDVNPWYEADRDLVRDKGAEADSTRTAEESVKAAFWAYDGGDRIGTAARLYGQITLAILDQCSARDEGSVETEDYVRLMALSATAMADAAIQAWYWKYTYDFWRPVVGVRAASGRSGCGVSRAGAGASGPDWRPLGAPDTNRTDRFTPNSPSYPSGHATLGGAVFQVIRGFMEERGLARSRSAGEADTIAFAFTSDECNGINADTDGKCRPACRRQFRGLWEATVENALSRVYLGVNWAFDGISRTQGGGRPRQGVPARPAELGAVGGTWLGREIGRVLIDKGLRRQEPVTPDRIRR